MAEGSLGGLLKSLNASSKNLSWRALAVCLACGLSVFLVESLSVPGLHELLSRGESELFDRFFVWRNSLPEYNAKRKELTDSIVIVTVDPESGRKLGLPGNRPWPRQVFADLISKLNQAGASVIACDIDLEGSSADERRAREVKDASGLSDDDRSLEEVLRKSTNILLSTNVDYLESPDNRPRVFLHTPFEPFVLALGTDSGCLGNASLPVDSDGIVRRSSLIFERFGNTTSFYKSFALRIAEKRFGARAIFENASNRVFLKDRIYPAEFRINFVGVKGSFRAIPLWRALDWQKHYGQIDRTGADLSVPLKNPFEGKIVLVGFAQSSFQLRAGASPRQAAVYEASFVTPVSNYDNRMPAIEIQANIVSNLINNSCLPPVERWKTLLTITIVALACGNLLGRLVGKPWTSAGCIAALAVAWLAAAFVNFLAFNQTTPVVVPIVGVALPCWFLVLADQNLYVFRERRKHTRLFRSMTAKHVAQEIDRAQLEELGLTGKKMQVTIMVCRMRDFMHEVESLPADRVFQVFNESIRIMIEQIFEHKGLVDRIASYGVIAFWGAPLAMPGEEQAKLAAQCAIAIRARIAALGDKLAEDRQGITLKCTCGINTGEAYCGTIDASSRDTHFAQYGALGYVVEEAGKLEELNPTYGTNFILGESTAALIEEHLEVRPIDHVKLSERDGGEPIYELLTAKGSLPAAMEEAIALFRSARQAFDKGNIKEAEQLFSTTLHLLPSDQPTRIMLKRCRERLSSKSEELSSSSEGAGVSPHSSDQC
ncbi:MAG TPA: adenylate/guanylate cyclase domain-containing protein [Candidatus Obscuribacterales bacterium]